MTKEKDIMEQLVEAVKQLERQVEEMSKSIDELRVERLVEVGRCL